MKAEDALLRYCEDKSSDLYKAMKWVENCIKRDESSFTLPDYEFNSLSTLHDRLVMLGYRPMIYTDLGTNKRFIRVSW